MILDASNEEEGDIPLGGDLEADDLDLSVLSGVVENGEIEVIVDGLSKNGAVLGLDDVSAKGIAVLVAMGSIMDREAYKTLLSETIFMLTGRLSSKRLPTYSSEMSSEKSSDCCWL